MRSEIFAHEARYVCPAFAARSGSAELKIQSNFDNRSLSHHRP